MSDRLGTVLGQSIVIENKGGGAGGSIGAKFVAAADPDGYTILITPGGSLTTGPAVHKNIGYDPVKVFVPVAQLIETPLVVSVHPSLPVKTMAELVAYAKANPGKVSWGSQGFGVAPHLLLELFKLETGVNIVHVPYRGTAPMLTAILAGEVQVVADPMTTSLAAHRGRQAAPDRDRRRRAHSETAGRADRGGGGLSQAAIAVLARRRGAGRHAARPSSTSSTPRSAKASSPPETRALLAKLGADIKIGTPAELRQDARRGARAVDRRGQGRQDQGGVRRITNADRHRARNALRRAAADSISAPKTIREADMTRSFEPA